MRWAYSTLLPSPHGATTTVCCLAQSLSKAYIELWFSPTYGNPYNDATLLTRVLKWILHATSDVSFPVLSTTALNCWPAHTTHAMQNWLQTNCPDFSGLKIHPNWTPWITISGTNIGGLSQVPSKTNHRIERSPAGDLGQPTSGTNRPSYQRVFKVTEGVYCSWGWTFWTFTVTTVSWLFCSNDVISHCDSLDIFERAKITRWQYCSADNFIS